MMNNTTEKTPLIDVTSEDDLLIDSQLDRASFDLRLSVALDMKPKQDWFHQARRTLRSEDPDEHLQVPNARRMDEFKSRESLAWDSAFFTSDGILDLRELSLVNEGFKNAKDLRSKVCKKRSSGCDSGTGETEESRESFLEFRVLDHRGKDCLTSSKLKTAPATNISLASQNRMKYGQVHTQMQRVNQQGSRGFQMCPARKREYPLPQPLTPSKANIKPASPKSASLKNGSSAQAGILSPNARKRWLCRSQELKGGSYFSMLGDNRNKKGGSDADCSDSPCKWVSTDCNKAQVSDKEGLQNPVHHRSVAGKEVQVGSSLKQNVAKAKRSSSPLPGDLVNSSKKPSRPHMPSQRIGFFDMDRSATQRANRISVLQSFSPESRGRSRVKDSGPSGDLKKLERKPNSHSATKKMNSLEGDDEKENMIYVENDCIYGGRGEERYVEITNLFEGMVIEPKGIKRKKASTSKFHAIGSTPPLRLKPKQSNLLSAVEEASTKSPLEGRASAFSRSVFMSLA